MSILHRIAQKETWNAFLEQKTSDGYLQLAECRELARFIEKEMYLPCVKKMLAGEPFSFPVKKEIAKIGKQMKALGYRSLVNEWYKWINTGTSF